MKKKNDGIYVVHNGEEFQLECTTPFDTLTKCGQCAFHKDGRCAAPESCLKIEVVFPDCFWKKTVTAGVTVYKEDDRQYALCYNDVPDNKITVVIDDDSNETQTTDRFIGEFNI